MNVCEYVGVFSLFAYVLKSENVYLILHFFFLSFFFSRVLFLFLTHPTTSQVCHENEDAFLFAVYV